MWDVIIQKSIHVLNLHIYFQFVSSYPKNAGKIDNAKDFECIVNSLMTAIPRITSVLFVGSLFSALNKKKKLEFGMLLNLSRVGT